MRVLRVKATAYLSSKLDREPPAVLLVLRVGCTCWRAVQHVSIAVTLATEECCSAVAAIADADAVARLPGDVVAATTPSESTVHGTAPQHASHLKGLQ
jgi:hypothetical protein